MSYPLGFLEPRRCTVRDVSEDADKQNPHARPVGSSAANLENTLAFPQCDPAFLGVYPPNENVCPLKHMYTNVHTHIIHNSRAKNECQLTNG